MRACSQARQTERAHEALATEAVRRAFRDHDIHEQRGGQCQ